MRGRCDKTAKLLLGYTFKAQVRRLKSELENCLQALIICIGRSIAQRMRFGTCFLEYPRSGSYLRGPGSQFSEDRGRHCSLDLRHGEEQDAAVALATHTSAVTKYIVERTSAMDVAASASNNVEALEALKITLEEVQAYLILLGTLRRRLGPWILANQEKDRFVQLNASLDRALAMSSAVKNFNTGEDVRANAGQIGIILSIVQRLDSDVTRTLTIMQTNQSEAVSARRNYERWPDTGFAPAEDRKTAFVPCLASSSFFFFFSRVSTPGL
ncbi:hypothetical protein DFH09DRAFT_280623 [Mycena vulgaris]|nr:hypothetical protein DFH09DRAFT_280623 [Mycena vulgaris]